MIPPIITSLLDTDWYKLLMGQFIYHYYRDTRVTLLMIDRGNSYDGAPVSINDVRDQLESARDLTFKSADLHFLKGFGIFSASYLEWLRTFKLPPYHLSQQGDKIVLSSTGPWCETTFWEIPFLSINNELITRARLAQYPGLEANRFQASAYERLIKKIERLRVAQIQFSDFGTRRRATKDYQTRVVCDVAEEETLFELFQGTSNVVLSKELGLNPIGTIAHEIPMVCTALASVHGEDAMRAEQDIIIAKWLSLNLPEILLTDTYGTEWCLKNLSQTLLQEIKALRIDSGDPAIQAQLANKILKERSLPIKPLIFSDGMDDDSMLELQSMFRVSQPVRFGWGEKFSNNWFPDNRSKLVAKIVRADNIGTVKLSDEISKAIGDPDEIRRYQNVFVS